jgi:chromosome segregation ATPase
MAEKVARFIIGIDGEEGDIASVLNAIKGKFRAAVSEIEATTRDIQLFRGLTDKVKGLEAELIVIATNGRNAADAMQAIQVKIDLLKASGAGIDKALNKELEAAQKAASNLGKEYASTAKALASQNAALVKVQERLVAAGVDTQNLAAEEVRLAEAAQQANRALVEQQSGVCSASNPCRTSSRASRS